MTRLLKLTVLTPLTEIRSGTYLSTHRISSHEVCLSIVQAVMLTGTYFIPFGCVAGMGKEIDLGGSKSQ